MRKTLLAFALLALTACHPWIFHPVNPEYRGWDHRSKAPEVIFDIAPAQQVCLPWKGEAQVVDIFIHIRNTKALVVYGKLNGTITVGPFYGTELQIHLQRVGRGYHYLDLTIPGLREAPYHFSFSVWDCPPEDKGALYEPYKPGRGARLKDYCDCPEAEPCPQ